MSINKSVGSIVTGETLEPAELKPRVDPQSNRYVKKKKNGKRYKQKSTPPKMRHKQY